jgi:hypothetical protein
MSVIPATQEDHEFEANVVNEGRVGSPLFCVWMGTITWAQSHPCSPIVIPKHFLDQTKAQVQRQMNEKTNSKVSERILGKATGKGRDS